jgi:hypothetical protein
MSGKIPDDMGCGLFVVYLRHEVNGHLFVLSSDKEHLSIRIGFPENDAVYPCWMDNCPQKSHFL